MSTSTGTADGVFGTFPYESVITPATVAGLVVAAAQYLLGLALPTSAFTIATPGFSVAGTGVTVESLIATLIGSIALIALIAGILGIVVSGSDTTVLVVGAILVYVGGLLSILLTSLYLPGSLTITADLLVAPLSQVVLMVGIGIGVNWIGVDVSL